MARNPQNSSRKAPQNRRTWNQSDEACVSGGSLTTGLLSLVGGAGIGAALMYLLDPEEGAERRYVVRERAKDAMHTGGELLGSAVESGTHALGSAWETVSGKASD